MSPHDPNKLSEELGKLSRQLTHEAANASHASHPGQPETKPINQSIDTQQPPYDAKNAENVEIADDEVKEVQEEPEASTLKSNAPSGPHVVIKEATSKAPSPSIDVISPFGNLDTLATKAINRNGAKGVAATARLLEYLLLLEMDSSEMVKLESFFAKLPHIDECRQSYADFCARCAKRRQADMERKFRGDGSEAEEPVIKVKKSKRKLPKGSLPKINQRIVDDIRQTMVLHHVDKVLDKIDPLLYRLLPDMNELRQTLSALLLSVFTVESLQHGDGQELSDGCLRELVHTQFRDELRCQRIDLVIEMFRPAMQDTLRAMADVMILDRWIKNDGELSDYNAGDIIDSLKQASVELGVEIDRERTADGNENLVATVGEAGKQPGAQATTESCDK
ncbi:hypothetical protein DFJ77DRAFT_441108 [Powellomyces hirtus]|nr:hypothetical protein DFJ77DRAFT_441108 [Powellomyces hirtus]